MLAVWAVPVLSLFLLGLCLSRVRPCPGPSLSRVRPCFGSFRPCFRPVPASGPSLSRAVPATGPSLSWVRACPGLCLSRVRACPGLCLPRVRPCFGPVRPCFWPVPASDRRRAACSVGALSGLPGAGGFSEPATVPRGSAPSEPSSIPFRCLRLPRMRHRLRLSGTHNSKVRRICAGRTASALTWRSSVPLHPRSWPFSIDASHFAGMRHP
ncbi:hypothetical protein FM112_07255 [Gulosibacter sp. 10]|nr:hypothetical protein FM112_07255 [Gulosibacter sp. 10]